MKKGRMVTSREMLLSLMWLFICMLLQSAPPAQGMLYVHTPDNATVNMGKSAIFTCTIQPKNGSLNFTAQFPQSSYVLNCPGPQIKYPSMSLYGTCEISSNQMTGTWKMSNIGNDVNGSAFTCMGKGLEAKTGYLWITGASAYYLMIFGCVTGGFFGILIVFGVTYIALKKSEKLQECFKGKEEEDVLGGVVEENLKD